MGSEYHGHRVTLRQDLHVSDAIVWAAGQAGICTADLPDDDVFAVWFFAAGGVGLQWVTLTQAHKAIFEVGPLDPLFPIAEVPRV